VFAIALEHSVWGFCCTNPCEQLSGEISTHLVPQLGLGDERLLHTILFSSSPSSASEVSRPYCSCDSSKGAPSSRGRFDPAYPEGLGPFRHLGFVCRGKTISLRAFLEGYHHHIFSAIDWDVLEAKGDVL
jgi:hypothetical protein